MDKNPYSHLFCEQPFTRLELSDSGDIYTCCPAWLRHPLGNFDHDGLDNAWNSSAAIEIRESIHDGSFRFCDKNLCPRLKAQDMPRKDITDPYLLSIIESKALVLDRPALRLNLCYDRSCNLQCPSCRSSLIYHRRGSEEWIRAKNVQDQVVEQLDQIEWLEVTGSGDPFASPLFFELIQQIDSSLYPNLKVFLHTNALLFTPKKWQEIKPAQDCIVKVEVSIDAATEKTYSRLRYPGDFKVLLSNLAFISDLYRNGPIEDLKLSFVVQIDNFREIPDFIRLGKQFGAKRVYFSALDNWGTFSESEYKRRAVHLPDHPRHSELLQLLMDLDYDPTFAEFGNLIDLIHQRN